VLAAEVGVGAVAAQAVVQAVLVEPAVLVGLVVLVLVGLVLVVLAVAAQAVAAQAAAQAVVVAMAMAIPQLRPPSAMVLPQPWKPAQPLRMWPEPRCPKLPKAISSGIWVGQTTRSTMA